MDTFGGCLMNILIDRWLTLDQLSWLIDSQVLTDSYVLIDTPCVSATIS